jgi:hypothetical protein
MKLFRFLATALLFLLLAITLKFDKSGKLCWIVCGFYLYLHLFFIKYVKMTHYLDNISSRLNIQVK